MNFLDLKQRNELLAPLSENSPCGPNLEYDAQFGELIRLARGQAEHWIGNTVSATPTINWGEVRKRSDEMLTQTKDIRLFILLVRSALAIGGIKALAEVMQVLAIVIESYWDTIHPQLDPEDQDPVERLNQLVALSDHNDFLRSINDARLVGIQGIGYFSMRDVRIAKGEIEPIDNQQLVGMSMIDTAFMQVPIEELRENTRNVALIISSIKNIEGTIIKKLGHVNAIDLSAAENVLRDIEKLYSEWLDRRDDSDLVPDGTTDSADFLQKMGGAVPILKGEILSRDDVICVIDKICTYYRRVEPSSPVPLLMKRARCLVNMDFFEVINNLLPEGIDQLNKLRGPQ